MKNIIFVIVIIFILIFSIVAINGCSKTIKGSSIKSEEDATNKIAEIGEDMGDVSDELKEMNQDLG